MHVDSCYSHQTLPHHTQWLHLRRQSSSYPGHHAVYAAGPKDLKESTNNRDITRNHPKGDGLWLLNLNTGQASLLVSLHAIAQHVSRYLSSGWNADSHTQHFVWMHSIGA